MQTAYTKSEDRDDALLGVCERLGEGIGIPSFLFRMAFIGLFFWNWALALIAYAAFGVLVFAVHKFIPDRKRASVTVLEPAKARNDEAMLDAAA